MQRTNRQTRLWLSIPAKVKELTDRKEQRTNRKPATTNLRPRVAGRRQQDPIGKI